MYIYVKPLSRASKVVCMNHYIPQSQLTMKACPGYLLCFPHKAEGLPYIAAVQATEAEDAYGVATRSEERTTP
jgi:hypothetical protein